MKNEHSSRLGLPNPRIVFGVLLCCSACFCVGALAQDAPKNSGIQVGHSYHNDVSPALRDLAVAWPPKPSKAEEYREANLNPSLHLLDHVDAPDPVVDRGLLGALVPNVMPPPILNFDGIPFPGVVCNCAPPDPTGAVGLTQYVQMVNEGYQVFDKTTGASILGPTAIGSIWLGFGQPCESQGAGDPVVLYDRLANRWLISQFAGAGIPTDECVAISTTSDATGTYNRYGFHLGSNFFDYPHIGTWLDGYYMSMNVFNSSGTAFIGPQAFAFDRAKMLAGLPATFITPGNSGSSQAGFLPADIDGTYYPPTGTWCPFVSFPQGGVYKVRLFHADFVTPDNTTFEQILPSPPAAGFTALCPGTRACVPQLPPSANLDEIGDRLMFRLAYRKFADGHEAVVGNYTVSSNGVAGVRWFEIRDITTTPTVFQESTYQPDTVWRWMGSAAMDAQGNLAVGFSASDATINPQIRYAGRLATDPPNTLAQGEAHLFDGTGSQSGSGNRWGDYSHLSVDPVDDCTFWYTQEYYATNAAFNWRTRIGNFKFAECVSTPHASMINAGATLSAENCTKPANMVIDPGETVTLSFCVQNAGTGPTANLVGTLQNTGGIVGASGPQTYGVVAPGASSCQSFTFTAIGNCGGPLTATIHFEDGSNDLGDVLFLFNMGVPDTTNLSVENFDSVTAPTLPTGWTSTASGAGVAWVTTTTNPNSAPNAAFAPNATATGDSELVSPTLNIPDGTHRLTFRNIYNMENGFDGMVLEISINGGPFEDIITAGGTFISGG